MKKHVQNIPTHAAASSPAVKRRRERSLAARLLKAIGITVGALMLLIAVLLAALTF